MIQLCASNPRFEQVSILARVIFDTLPMLFLRSGAFLHSNMGSGKIERVCPLAADAEFPLDQTFGIPLS
jgi:hypothetical protein